MFEGIARSSGVWSAGQTRVQRRIRSGGKNDRVKYQVSVLMGLKCEAKTRGRQRCAERLPV